MQEVTLTKEELIKEEIITTAQKLFQRYGFQKTTMEDIAKAMGRGKSTLYYYYKSKDVIFRDVIIHEANEVMNAVTDICKQEGTANEKLYNYISTFLIKIRSKVSLYDVIKKEFIEEGSTCMHHPGINGELLKFDERQKELVKEILILGIENKEFSQRIENDIDLIAQIFNISLGGFVLNFALGLNNNPLYLKEDKMKVMIDIIVNGIKT